MGSQVTVRLGTLERTGPPTDSPAVRGGAGGAASSRCGRVQRGGNWLCAGMRAWQLAHSAAVREAANAEVLRPLLLGTGGAAMAAR